MAETLKSISRQIHWSSLLRAVIFAFAWLIVPFWFFALIALYLYFVPVPGSKTVAWPFLILLILMFFEPAGFAFALLFGATFFYILLIKELVLIDRESAYEVAVLFLAFLACRDLYLHEGGAINIGSLTFAFFAALLIGRLLASFIKFGTAPQLDTEPTLERRHVRRTAVWISTLIAWQMLIVGLFLPVDFVYQAVAAFLGIALLFDLVPQYLVGKLSSEKTLITASIIFALFVIVIGSARWVL